MLKISFACCLGLCPVTSSQFTLEMCVAASNHDKKISKNPYFGVQGRSGHRCWYSRKARQRACYDKQQSVSICNLFHARRANSGKITISKEGGEDTPLWFPCSRGISSPSGTKLPHLKLETLGYHMVKTRSFYLTWAWFGTWSWQMDGPTDRGTGRQNSHS